MEISKVFEEFFVLLINSKYVVLPLPSVQASTACPEASGLEL